VCAGRSVGGGPGGSTMGVGKVAVESRKMWVSRGRSIILF